MLYEALFLHVDHTGQIPAEVHEPVPHGRIGTATMMAKEECVSYRIQCNSSSKIFLTILSWWWCSAFS